MATKKVTKSCFDLSYDLLTISISFADVVTDIIVLIDFYQKDRIIFFIISLVILILAQCAYSVAFAANFETFDKWKWYNNIIAFFLIMPFGSMVAFCIYMDQNGYIPQILYDTFGLGHDPWFSPKADDGDLTKWIKTKLNKHLGIVKISIYIYVHLDNVLHSRI